MTPGSGVGRSTSSTSLRNLFRRSNSSQAASATREAPPPIGSSGGLGRDGIAFTGESSNPDALPFSYTPKEFRLINAVKTGKISEVDDLLSTHHVEGDLSPDLRGETGRTLLQESVSRGHYSTSETLIEHGAGIDSTDKNGYTALLLAVEMGKHEEANLLLRHGANPNKRNHGRMNAVILAVANGHTAVFRILQEHGVDLKVTYDKGQNLLMASALNGHENIVEDLLEKNIDPNLKDDNLRTALFYAAKNGHSSIVGHLLRHNAESNIKAVDGHTPLIAASRYHYGLRGDPAKVIKLLLENNANPNIKDDKGRTALSYAAESGHTDIVKILLNHDGDPKIADKKNMTPLDFAYRNERSEIMEILSQHRENGLKNKGKSREFSPEMSTERPLGKSPWSAAVAQAPAVGPKLPFRAIAVGDPVREPRVKEDDLFNFDTLQELKDDKLRTEEGSQPTSPASKIDPEHDEHDAAVEENRRMEADRDHFEEIFRSTLTPPSSQPGKKLYAPTRAGLAEAIFDTGYDLQERNQPEEAITRYNQLIAWYGREKNSKTLNFVTKACVNTRILHQQLGHPSADIESCDWLVTHFTEAHKAAEASEAAKLSELGRQLEKISHSPRRERSQRPEIAELEDLADAQIALLRNQLAAQTYGKHEVTEEEKANAVKLFKMASQLELNENQELIFKCSTVSAARGHVGAKAGLGLLYKRGYGAEKDLATAAEYYAEAAESGMPEANYQLGLLYEKGEGVEKNPATAAECYTKAAESKEGHADAACRLGLAYACGEGVEKNLATAAKWWTKAAEREEGHADAECFLGFLYDRGSRTFGIKRNKETAVKYWTKAAEKGFKAAQDQLDRPRRPRDEKNAVTWWTKTDEEGNVIARNDYLDGVADSQFRRRYDYDSDDYDSD